MVNPVLDPQQPLSPAFRAAVSAEISAFLDRQHVVVQIGSGTHPGSLVALRLPGELR